MPNLLRSCAYRSALKSKSSQKGCIAYFVGIDKFSSCFLAKSVLLRTFAELLTKGKICEDFCFENKVKK